MNNLIQRVAPALALCLAVLGPAHAQGRAAPSPTASSPLQYRSAFADYKPWQDIGPGDWRALNDAVKGDSMPGMDMSRTEGAGDAKGMPDMPGMRGSSGREAPMPVASTHARTGHAHTRAKAAPMPAKPAMDAHHGHDMKGGRQ